MKGPPRSGATYPTVWLTNALKFKLSLEKYRLNLSNMSWAQRGLAHIHCGTVRHQPVLKLPTPNSMNMSTSSPCQVPPGELAPSPAGCWVLLVSHLKPSVQFRVSWQQGSNIFTSVTAVTTSSVSAAWDLALQWCTFSVTTTWRRRKCAGRWLISWNPALCLSDSPSQGCINHRN